jgi:hypothetical protein
VTADAHVHFLSPSTAVLEAQAELNLVNLLAAQWGDLYTNVGDLPYGHIFSADKQTMVAVGTENRQHDGHLGLLGGHEPVFPCQAMARAGLPGIRCGPVCRIGPTPADGGTVWWWYISPIRMPRWQPRSWGKIDAVELYPRETAPSVAGYCDWHGI